MPPTRSCCPVKPGLECPQEWGIHSFSKQPVPLLHHLLVKSFLLTAKLSLPSASLKLLPCPITIYPCKKSLHLFYTLPLNSEKGAMRFSQAEQPQFSQPIPTAKVFSTLSSFMALHWTYSNRFTAFSAFQKSLLELTSCH